MRNVMAHLTHPTLSGWVIGLVREDETVLAFGRVDNTGVKTRVGSITRECDGEGFIVLTMDGEEARPSNQNELFWFLWAFDVHGNMDKATIWMHSRG
jgi:hypothetical protein